MNRYFQRAAAFLSFAMLAAAGHAAGGSCEDNFESMGDPRNGSAYTTSALVANTNVQSAIGQLRAIAQSDGFKVLNEDGDGKSSTLVIEQSKGVKNPFQIYLSVNTKGSGTEVTINTRLNKGATARDEDMRNGMCGMIARIKPGKEGEAIGAQARRQSPQEEIIDMKAIDLARELDDVRKLDSEQVLNRYKGRTYRLDGKIKQPLENEGTIEIWYHVLGNWAGGEGWWETVRAEVVCRLARDQIREAKLLRSGDMARLTGKVVKYEPNTPRKLILENCRFSH